MNVGKFSAKEKFQEDLKDTKIQHKLIGEKVWPVLFFQGRRDKIYIEYVYMNQLDACDVQLFPLEDQTAEIQDYKKWERRLKIMLKCLDISMLILFRQNFVKCECDSMPNLLLSAKQTYKS